MTTLTVEERVARGADLLDREGPEDWRDRIRPAELDISDCSACILGQVYGWYYEGLQDLFGDGYTIGLAANCGFDAESDSGRVDWYDYDALRAGWLDYLGWEQS